MLDYTVNVVEMEMESGRFRSCLFGWIWIPRKSAKMGLEMDYGRGECEGFMVAGIWFSWVLAGFSFSISSCSFLLQKGYYFMAILWFFAFFFLQFYPLIHL